MLNKGMFLKHNRFMDVCIFINKHPVKLTDGRLVVRGEFWNMGFVNSWPLNIKFSKVMTKDELKQDYHVAMLTNEDCLRKCIWIKL